MWLVCNAVGAAGPTFVVGVDASDLIVTVATLVVREAFQDTTLRAADLELFLAREPDGSWLSVRDEVMHELDEGHVPSRVQAIVDQPPLSIYDTVERHFGTAPPTESLHLLVRVSPIATAKAIAPNVMLYGSFETRSGLDGINLANESKILKRSVKTRQVLDKLDEDHVLLVKSPPMTGKTSLAALVCDELKNRSIAQKERVAIVSFSMISIDIGETFFDAFKRMCSIGWSDVLSLATKGYTLYFVLDETQMIYTTNTTSPQKKSSEFWRLIKQILATKRGIHVLMFASYGSNIQYVDLGTPVQIPTDRVLGMDLLNLSPDEMLEYVTKCFAGYVSLGDAIDEFCRMLGVLTGGHVGLCVTAILTLNEVYSSHKCRDASPPSAQDWIRMIQSGDLDGNKDRLFTQLVGTRAVQVFNRLGSEVRRPLERLLRGSHTNEDEVLFRKCVKAGVLVCDGVEFDFSSPVLWRYFVKTSMGHVQRAVDAPASLEELIMRCLQAIDYDAIRNTLGRSRQSCIPLERAWQMVFYLAVERCTPVDYKTSADVGGLFGSPGYLDFTVHREDLTHPERLMWGIELLREGNQLSEHLARFDRGGRYARINLTDHCLLDFRREKLVGNVGKRARDMAAVPSLPPKVFVVWYSHDLTEIVLYHGESKVTIHSIK